MSIHSILVEIEADGDGMVPGADDGRLDRLEEHLRDQVGKSGLLPAGARLRGKVGPPPPPTPDPPQKPDVPQPHKPKPPKG